MNWSEAQLQVVHEHARDSMPRVLAFFEADGNYYDADVLRRDDKTRQIMVKFCGYGDVVSLDASLVKAPPPLPEGFVEKIDPDSGFVYFTNTTTNESSWERPTVKAAARTIQAAQRFGAALKMMEKDYALS